MLQRHGVQGVKGRLWAFIRKIKEFILTLEPSWNQFCKKKKTLINVDDFIVQLYYLYYLVLLNMISSTDSAVSLMFLCQNYYLLK